MEILQFINRQVILLLFVKGIVSSNISSLECPFTDGLCQWSNEGYTWKLGDLNDLSFGKPTHPIFNGGYIYPQDNANQFNQIISPVIDEKVEPFCLVFAYYMFGPDVDQLKLRLIDASGPDSSWLEVDDDVWRRKGSQRDDWSIGRYHFKGNERSKLQLGFIASSSGIALGPIKVNPGSCDLNDFCDFEDLSSCFWSIEPDYRSSFSWSISDAKSSNGQLIGYDTTTHTESGKFLRTPNNGLEDSKSILISKVKFSFMEAKCLTFNMFKANSNSDLVEIGVQNDNRSSEYQYIWSSSSIGVNSEWQPIQVNLIHSDGDFNILISGHKHSNQNDTSIAIDDLQVSPIPCNKRIDCSFDNGNCRFNVISGPLLVGSGRLSHANTLNYSMDTYKNNDPDDFFIYTDPSSEDGTVTYQLTSPLVLPLNFGCLSFTYFMESIDRFANYFFEVNVQSVSGNTLTKFEPQVKFTSWTKVEYLLSVNEPFQVQFNLTVENKLFAGFDDIKLVEGKCGQNDDLPKPPLSTAYEKDSFNDKSKWSFWTNWVIREYKKTESPSPMIDPFGQSNGKYVSISSGGEKIRTAVMKSKAMKKGQYCLSIWFWCSSIKYNRLFVSLIELNTNRSTPVIDKKCTNQYHWIVLEATFNSKNDYLNKIEIVGETEDGSIALDEMTIYDGFCHHDQLIDQTCTFDDGTDCGIDVVTSPFYNWNIKSGNQVSRQVIDKSTNTLNGKFLALDVAPISFVNGSSYFYLANLKREDDYCLSFSYYIKGDDLALGVWKTDRSTVDSLPDPLATYNNRYGQSWVETILQISSMRSESDIVFGGSYIAASTGLIAIDDLKVSQGKCISSGECNFDSVCDWTNYSRGSSLFITDIRVSYTASAEWQFNEEAEMSKWLGLPRQDHTYSSEKSIYGYTSLFGRKAILASPVLYLGKGEISLCLKLAYVSEKNNIQVLVGQQEGQASIVKSLKSEDMRKWNEADITIPLKPSPSRMARVYLVTEGKSAIDDISVHPGSCPVNGETFQCYDGTKISVSKRCDYKNDCSRGEDEVNCGSCEFNETNCGFNNKGQSFWNLKNDYITMDSFQMTFGTFIRGSISSPVIQETSSSCKVNFSYTKHKTDRLFASLLTESKAINIWDDSMIDESADWNDISIALGHIRSPFKLTFTGTSSHRLFEYQKICIDYVRFVDCDFNDRELTDSHAFVCSDGQRIGSGQVCDFVQNCRLGEDEDNCNHQIFTFEHAELYPWVSENGTWTITSESGLSNKPTLDHTRRSPNGRYVFTSALTLVDRENESGSLISPSLNATKDCTISFWYYLSSKSFNLRVNLSYSDAESDLVLLNIDQLSDFGFKHVAINLESNVTELSPFQIKFIGIRGDGLSPESFIALDDIAFTSSCFGVESDRKSSEKEVKPDTVKFCSDDQFYCTIDEKCIPIDRTCDYRSDCWDGEDEKFCGSCSFTDLDLCGWINEGTSPWIPMNLSSAQQQGFPTNLMSPDLFLVATGSSSEGSSALRSPLLGVTSSMCVFKFKYHLSIDTKLTIRLRQADSVISKVIKELDYSPKKWIDYQLELPSLTRNHYLQFVLHTPSTNSFLVPSGLADFNLLYCDPSKVNSDSFNCDFTSDTCNWTQTGSRGLNWILIANDSYDERNFGFGKYSNQDHPNFLTLNITNANRSSESIRSLISPWQYATETMCFSFDYRLLAFEETTFAVIFEKLSPSVTRTLFLKNGEPNYGWNQVRLTIGDTKEFRLAFKVNLKPGNGNIVISLDNLRLSSGPCSVYQASCDFSTDTCDWINQGWSTVRKQQVPSADGEYREFYLRNYGNRKSTLVLKGSTGLESFKCLAFWYYHTFNVTSDLKINLLNGEEILSSQIVPNHEIVNIWTYYRKSVLVGNNHGVSIEAGPLVVFDTTGIDDVTLYDRDCDSPGTCDFEFDSCGWQDHHNIWHRNLGVTPSTDNSLADHLNFNQRGWFMFVQDQDLHNGNQATLTSVTLMLGSPVCLSFLFLFTDNSSSGAKVTIKLLNALTDQIHELDSLITDDLIEWRSYEKTIRSDYPFKVLLIASGRNGSGDIAIDDIQLISNKCPNEVVTPSKPIITPTAATEKQTTSADSTEETTQPTFNVTSQSIKRPDDQKNSLINLATFYSTINKIRNFFNQNIHLTIIGIIVGCISLLSMAFFVQNYLKPSKRSGQHSNQVSILADNALYDIYLSRGQSNASNGIYEEINTSTSSVEFEMKALGDG